MLNPLERLVDPALVLLACEDRGRLAEEVDYLARRLAKLKVPLERVLVALDQFQGLAQQAGEGPETGERGRPGGRRRNAFIMPWP